MNGERIDRIMASLEGMGVEQVLLSDPYNVCYITGDLQHPWERFLGLFLRKGRAPKLILNNLFTSPSVEDGDIIRYDDSERGALKVLDLADRTRPMGIDKQLAAEFLLELQENGAASSYVNASPCVDRVRMVKDAEEIRRMVYASQLNDEAMSRIKAEIRGGVTERQLKEKLVAIYKDLGADGVSFSPIVSFGANAADPHHSPDGTALREGDCVLFDIGCVKDGYCSDMTRTFYYGFAGERDREIYAVTERANRSAEAMIKPGVRFCDIDATARGIITDAGYGPNFTHRLGHCIGAQCHEWGDVGRSNTDAVKPGMIFSCEPGIYIAGESGVRIEDLCLVTEDGVEILNSFPKELEVIESR